MFSQQTGKDFIKKKKGERKMIAMLVNTNFILTVVFLIFCAGFFLRAAWKDRENMANMTGNAIAAYFMLSALIMIWGS